MVSTYTTNLNVEKPGIGEQDGTWGGTVNTDFDLYDEAINGIAIVTLAAAGSSGSPNIETITQGASADARSPYIQFTDGGDLGADVYVQLAPDTAEKIAYIYNNLSGSQDLYLFQGTWDAARDYTLAAGKTALVKFSGAGAGASTVTEVMGDMQFNGGLDFGDISISGTTISTTGGTDLNLTPLAGQQLVLDATVIVDAGIVTGITALTTDDFTVQNSQYIQEAAAGQGDIAGYGQLWVQNDAPNTLWFKDDAGTSYQLGVGGTNWKTGTELGFYSMGIKDNATARNYLWVYDTSVVVGVGDTEDAIIQSLNPGYNLTIQVGEVTLSGAADGAGIVLHGATEIATADDIELIDSSGTVMHYDSSATTFDFQANDITTTGNLLPGGTAGPTWGTGAGTPEAAVTAPIGSLFTRTDGGANTTLYVKESGAGNTGWVAK